MSARVFTGHKTEGEMTKKSVIHGLALGGAMMSLMIGAGAQGQTVTVPQPAPPQAAIPSFPNMAVARAKPQAYADHMKALQDRKDVANAVLPVPRTAPTAPATPPSGPPGADKH